MQRKQGCIAQGIVAAYHPNGLTCIARAHRNSRGRRHRCVYTEDVSSSIYVSLIV